MVLHQNSACVCVWNGVCEWLQTRTHDADNAPYLINNKKV